MRTANSRPAVPKDAARPSVGDGPFAAYRADIVIIGAGTAGIPCAILAAQAGAQVIVVEKERQIGGTLHITGGHLSGGGTRRQQARGIEDSPNQHYDDVLRISKGTADPWLTRLAVEEAPRLLDWLDDLGFPFEPDTPRIIHAHEPYWQPRTCWGTGLGQSILETLRPLWDAQVKAGRITSLLGHSFRDLMVEEGRVVGVCGHSRSGAFAILAEYTVLTTGGYGSNPEFFAQVTPGEARLASTTHPNAKGDGIVAAQRIGADFRNADKYLPSWGGLELEPGSGRLEWEAAWTLIFTSLYRPPREIYVNAWGQRFINEDEPSAHARELALLRQPGHKLWLIFDEPALEDGLPLLWRGNHDQLRAYARTGRFAWQADDLATLARRAGIDEAGLQTTVDAYNQAVREGVDPLGRKDLRYPILMPPFYAISSPGSTLFTFGGLTVDATLRVLSEAGKPIPGLYAAGEILGAGAMSGHAFCSGMLLTSALSFGRLLGKRLASQVLARRGGDHHPAEALLYTRA